MSGGWWIGWGASVVCRQTFPGVLACEFSHCLGARTPASAGGGTPSSLAAGDGYATIGDNQQMHPIGCGVSSSSCSSGSRLDEVRIDGSVLQIRINS